jgi:hypothetical protein
VRYLDRDFFHALLDPRYAQHLGIGHIDTGLSPDDTVEALLEHEGDEKVILDADNDLDIYPEPHELATCGEHQKVKDKGGTPLKYERGLRKAIAWCEKKHIAKPPLDLDCAPYLDDPDQEDKRALEAFRRAGVTDSSKESKGAVDYSKSTGADRCDGCASWVDDPQQAPYGLGGCKRIAGLVRVDRWCRRYQKSRKLDHMAHAEWRSARLQRPVQHASQPARRIGVPAMGQ